MFSKELQTKSEKGEYASEKKGRSAPFNKNLPHFQDQDVSSSSHTANNLRAQIADVKAQIADVKAQIADLKASLPQLYAKTQETRQRFQQYQKQYDKNYQQCQKLNMAQSVISSSHIRETLKKMYYLQLQEIQSTKNKFSELFSLSIALKQKLSLHQEQEIHLTYQKINQVPKKKNDKNIKHQQQNSQPYQFSKTNNLPPVKRNLIKKEKLSIEMNKQQKSLEAGQIDLRDDIRRGNITGNSKFRRHRQKTRMSLKVFE